MSYYAQNRVYPERKRFYNEFRSKDLSSSVQLAVDSCIKDGILADFLTLNKMGVIGMILEEYTLEKQLERVQHNSYTDGRNELFSCIQRLKNGESESSILDSGIPAETLAMAKEAIK